MISEQKLFYIQKINISATHFEFIENIGPFSYCICFDSAKDVRSLTQSTSTESALAKAAGNGMHLPSAAFTCLVAMICLSEK